jgi:hypothetical protein
VIGVARFGEWFVLIGKGREPVKMLKVPETVLRVLESAADRTSVPRQS